MSMRRRTFVEVLDALLVGICGGVAGEQHPYPPPGADDPPQHALLQPPAASVVSVYGALLGEPHRFREPEDYTLTDGGTTLVWTTAGDRPDESTAVDVNYVTASTSAVLTDLAAGSVVRTLAETVAVELARLYATLAEVHRAGLLETATGRALDRVVGLLDIERVRAGRATGELEFTRVPRTAGALPILAGTRVRDVSGEVEYETTATVTMTDGQDVVRVLARDLEPNDSVPAGTLTVMSTPQAGIASVTNPRPTARSTRDETDDQLRDRTRNVLQGSARATPAALRAAVVAQGVGADLLEPFGPSGVPSGRLGVVSIRPRADALPPDLLQRVLQAIEDTRPAGVLVTVRPGVRPSTLDLQLRLTTRPGLLPEDLVAAQAGVRRVVTDAVAALSDGVDLSLNRLAALSLGVPGVEDVHVLSAMSTPPGGQPEDVVDRDAGLLKLNGRVVTLGTVGIVDPALPTEVDVTVVPEAGATVVEDHLRRALGELLAALDARTSTGAGTGATLRYDDLVAGLALPAGQHRVTVVVTPPGAVSALLSESGDAYPVQPFERLAPAGVTVTGAAP